MKVDFKQFPSNVSEVISSNNSAQMALSRLENGTADTEHTWFYEDVLEKQGPEAVIAPVVAELKGMTDWTDIASWDLSKLDKFQAQGRTAPFDERLDKFEEYFTHLETPPIVKDENFKEAKKMAVRALGFNQTGVPLTIAEVVERGIKEDKYQTNSGYPQFGKRKRPEIISRSMEDAESGKALSERYPFMVGSRAQMGKVGPDARFIFMAPMANNLIGQRFAQPAQDYLTSLAERRLRELKSGKAKATLSNGYYSAPPNDYYYTFFTPWLGWDKVQEVVSLTWNDAGIRFGADYTKMDQHFNKHHAMEVYDVLKYYFKREYWPELRQAMLYPFTAPILTSKGYVDQEHALLSGSEWTNLVETLWNFIFLFYIWIKGEEKNVVHGNVAVPLGIGDDQLWMVVCHNENTEEDRIRFRDFVLEGFELAGLPGNPIKQEGIENPDVSGFLQRHLQTGYNGPDNDTPVAGVYSLIRNVTSQVFPERYHNDSEYDWKAFAIRVIMIAENCNKHPLFQWYVKDYIAKANKNILRFVKLTDSEIDVKWNRVKNMAGFRPNYNQEKQDKPLTQFDTFKILRSLVK